VRARTERVVMSNAAFKKKLGRCRAISDKGVGEGGGGGGGGGWGGKQKKGGGSK